jgi:membrane associated rhomboid family serine protease
VCPSCGSLVGVRDDKCYTCGRTNPGLWGFAPMLRALGTDFPFSQVVVGVCGTLWAITLLMSGSSVLGGGSLVSMLSPNSAVLIVFGASGAAPVFAMGRWWTVLSAGWLHAGALHILFNMLWVRQLAPPAAEIYGPSRTIIIYTIASVAGFLLSSVAGLVGIPRFGAFLTVGASAPIFGLLGAMMHYGRRGGSSLIHAEAKGYAVAMFVFGLIMPGVDNAAHLGGFFGGYIASVWLDPLRPERVNHMIGALVCLGLTALSIVASLVMIVPYLFR